MIAILSVALAGSALAAATPIEPNSWFTSKEHPKTALAVTQEGQLSYRIDISPQGAALRCTPAKPGDLGLKVCDIVLKRARFVPAVDQQGQPAFGMYDGVASFLMPGRKGGRPDRSKLVVTTQALPDGVPSPAFARIAFIVDSTGGTSHCVTAPGERRRFMQTIDALGPLACTALGKDYRALPARDGAGGAVTSVQSILVRFEQPIAP